MCEQTEINYLDGDVVWVKLGSYWWPGQVVGKEKLPEDIQVEFYKKPLIAAVKFFHEDSFEFVKNYQQIYKYNCTQKEEFIRKGLDKYRTRSKDGSNYMNKFPEDVKTAETLTNGDPNILLNEKFNPEEKPDISGLFGEKKIMKKKRNRDEFIKKGDNDVRRRVTHPRFLRENDHEVRIRQQPKNPPSTSCSNFPSAIYPCHVCGFTATRVNIIICHLKNHRLNKETNTTIKSKVKANIPSKPKQNYLESPKRKYIRKSLSTKIKRENSMEFGKRKYCKVEKSIKKKKSDPELREKLLADWNVDTDEDEPVYVEKSINVSSIDLSSKNKSYLENTDETNNIKTESNKNDFDNSDKSILLLQASDKFLQETTSFAHLSILKDIPSNLDKMDDLQNNMEKLDTVSLLTKGKESFHFKKTTFENSLLQEKDDKKSKLSCFDFNEDDLPEPNISSVRKIPRSLGSKNMSIKKEIIKEFEMSQALKNDEENFFKNDEVCRMNLKIKKQFTIAKEQIQMTKDIKDNNTVEIEENKECKNSDKNNQNLKKSIEVCETHLEIVEILEVEKEDEEKNIIKDELKKEIKKEKLIKMKVENADIAKIKNQNDITKIKTKNKEILENDTQKKIEKEITKNIFQDEKIEFDLFTKNKMNENKEILLFGKEVNNLKDVPYNISVLEAKQNLYTSRNQDAISDQFTFEIKNNTNLATDSIFEFQKKSDVSFLSNFNSTSQILLKDEDNINRSKDNLNFNIKKRRGRPRKNLTNAEDVLSDNEHLKSDLKKKTESNQKVSKSDLDCSYSVIRRKRNRKYQSSLYSQKFDSRSSKSDESLSESDDKPEEIKNKIKMDVKLASNKANNKLIDKIQNWKSSINNTENTNSVGVSIKKNTVIKDFEIKEVTKEQNNILVTKEVSQQSNYNNVKEEKNSEEDKIFKVQQNSDVEILYPKKCQIKKFELSKIDGSDSSSVKYLNIDLNNHLYKVFDGKKNIKIDLKNETSKFNETSQIEHTLNEDNTKRLENVDSIKIKMESKSMVTNLASTIENSKNHYDIDDVEKHVSDKTIKIKKGKFDNNQFDSFQDAFIKTLKIDNSLKKESISEIQTLDKKNIYLNDIKKVSVTETTMNQNFTQKSIITNVSIMDNFDSIGVLADNKAEEKLKENVSFANDKNIIQPSNDSALTIKSSNLIISENPVMKFNEDLKKFDDSKNSTLIIKNDNMVALSTPHIKDTVPVKKREKPRIIENVTLKEPMILKTKLMEKHIGKIGKHKLESDNFITDELKKFSTTKIMKMETFISNSKNKSHTIGGNNLIMRKKKTSSEDDSSITDIRNEQIISVLPKSESEVPCTEKYIQQSSQSLVDMDLDINSMPFVLSEDVLTPESIEQMPVVISSILPAKIPISTTLSTTLITPPKQILSTNQSFDSSKEINEVCPKKKSDTPAILKNKNKSKPTITSIKTIVPPLTSATYKGNYKVNTQALKTSLANQKTPGKYVIVQTSGHQQAYSTHHKVAIPTSKGSGNAQIVQQGSKVVILTSPQSSQSGQKILPLNSISKALNSGKVQKIITSKHGQQIYTSINPQSFVGSKTILTSSGDCNSPTTSKTANQKMLSQQQLITSKSVLTQLPGTIAKSNILGGLPQGILTKDGIFTPINASTLGGKTIISSKTLVTKNFPHQSTSISKNNLIPMTQSLSSKTIINSQGIVSKGTVLTPITGSQVKALAAKNVKGNKLQNQLDQHKVQLPGVQKNQKIPISSSLVRSNTNLKTPSSLMVLQKTDLKTKKDFKQTIQKPSSVTTVLSPSSVMGIQQIANTACKSLEQKIISSKNANRSMKLQQKLVTEKAEESVIFKSSTDHETSSLKTKYFEQQKQIVCTPISKSNKDLNKNLHKKVSNISNSVSLSPSNINTPFSISVPTLESINHEKIPKKEQMLEQISSKIETNSQHIERENTVEPKISIQPQIMALPTENSDGTQTYVLVTVDEQGHIIPLDNNTLMSLDGISNLDGSRTLYIDSSSLTESESVENIVLQIDNSSLSNIHTTNITQSTPVIVTEALSSSEIGLTTNQDILAAALANTDFQHDIGVVECSSSTTMTNLTQTNLINQTILQSTIIPPTEPISSPLVLETSLTLNQPIMTPLEVPSTLSIQSDLTPVSSTTIIPTPMELPITKPNESISYIPTEEPLLQISDNSVSQIEESIETAPLKNRVDIKISSNSQCIIETNLIESVINKNPETESKLVSDVSYSFSMGKIDFNKKQIQTTPSMPIIDDTFNTNNGFDSTNTSIVTDDNLRNYVSKTSEELIQDLTGNDSLQDTNSESVSNDKSCCLLQEISKTPQIILDDMQDHCISSQQSISTIVGQSEKENTSKHTETLNKIKKTLNTNDYINKEIRVVSSESTDFQSSHELQSYVVASKPVLVVQESTDSKNNLKLNKLSSEYQSENLSSEAKSTSINKEKITEFRDKNTNVSQTSNLLVQDTSNQVSLEKCKLKFINEKSEMSEQIPSQSYKQFASVTSNIVEIPSQSAKSQEATQSLSYESRKKDGDILSGEPPTQSYKDSKQNETCQSHKSLRDININAPTQSFNEMMEVNENKVTINKIGDDRNFPTQSYEVERIENLVENMETETEIGQEGNSPSQSNDIGVDSIGTTSVSTNNLVLNEDETASSSYVPETPENQERDQDQESAISTSSYEIPPCEELNIASSSAIPDTSVQSEHSSIHNNGVPEIPSSSYNLNPDSSSTQIDSVPTSSYEDQIIVEQNVSTSYEVPISMSNLEATDSQNYVTDSSDERNEATSYYSHHEEVTESYYETMCKQSRSRLETNSEEEATPSYYESNPVHITSEASQSYFNQEETNPSYSNHDISPSYYDPRVDGEASQSYYSTHELNRSTQSAHQNVEATQSFYQENSDGQRLQQQGEATPSYTDRYSLDYVPVSSPLDRHDLVESSVPARSMDR